jgi:predicted CoA-substrate-specific enzyme activase
MIFCGVDVGSSTTKVVLIDGDKHLLGWAVRRSGTDFAGGAERCLQEALEKAGIKEMPHFLRTVSTGYGRKNVRYSQADKTEISCHARGCWHYFPEAQTIIDIGGQDNKVILLDDQGRRRNFKMNRKCAAGTGAFLEEVAQRMDVPLDQIDLLARQASSIVHMGSYCTVFTKTEILAHLRAGKKVPEIVAGLIESVVKRIVEMDPLEGEVVISGGVVAHNPVLADMLAKHLGHPVQILPNAQLAGAFGAALLAAEEAKNN